MIGLKSTLILALAAFSAAASIDSAVISRRQASGVTCGNNNYSSNQVQAAVDRGCSLFASGSTVGSNNYPHRFNNREQLPFPIDGPYQEFPILNNKVYTGGSPGADRVAFTTKNDGTCTFAGAMTHTGASGNNFVSCRGSTSVSDAPTDKPEKTEKQNNAASSLSAGVVAMPVIAAVLVAM
ncbi:guanyl-specific ribonuclease F1 [Pyricularia oryzae Y34]|uniref:ribonuclease T1 n=1 Tax=Pyricularia oryzae (strain Y34) TaxID=1143189 RepID=A0AA97PP60_PYRO3|nr:guanyl-specific ribonuclease F1 [Pyricularia oryzae Y34]